MRKTAAQEILPPEDATTVADVENDFPELREKYRIFADAIVDGKSGAKSAEEAGYKGYNLSVQANKLLKLPEIQAYIAAKKAKIANKTEYDATKWRRELIAVAHSNVADFTRLNEDGDLEVDFSGATREQLAAVSAVKVKKRKIYDNRGNVVGEEHNSEFRLWDKLRAAELLGRHSGFLAEPEQKIVVDVADRLLRARSRVMHGAIEGRKSEDSQSLGGAGEEGSL